MSEFGTVKCQKCRLKRAKQWENDYACPRCNLMLLFMWGDERTDTLTGPEIRRLVFAEYERKTHMARIEDWLSNHNVTEVRTTDESIQIRGETL